MTWVLGEGHSVTELDRKDGPTAPHAIDVLTVSNLHVSFFSREGVVRAVRGVNFRIPDGKTVGIVGESGSGKSVTARAILQIVPAPGRIVDGSILLRGSSIEKPVDIAKLDPASKAMRKLRGKEIGIIFQEPMTALSPVHTIGNQIIESIRLHSNISHSEAQERARSVLDRVGVPSPSERLNSYPFQLSGGLRQRAMIAMSLACKPSILIADEPTTALDVTIQAQILDLLKDLQEEMGMSIMLITHDLAVVARTADYVVVMYLGQVVEEASVRQLFREPKHPYTRGLMRSVPSVGVEGALVPIQGTVPAPHERVSGCAFHPRCPDRIPGKCDTFMPALTRTNGGGHVRCFLYSDSIEEPVQVKT